MESIDILAQARKSTYSCLRMSAFVVRPRMNARCNFRACVRACVLSEEEICKLLSIHFHISLHRFGFVVSIVVRCLLAPSYIFMGLHPRTQPHSPNNYNNTPCCTRTFEGRQVGVVYQTSPTFQNSKPKVLLRRSREEVPCPRFL